ncbi:hypothetical protein ACIBF5_29430 [Micromonospora sp. NPDC050417]|uniref:hypothetical protein n=1 Tax=Micromonospora sp. NPDC050417 TaxID=3364280 RepID=UPI0037B32E06
MASDQRLEHTNRRIPRTRLHARALAHGIALIGAQPTSDRFGHLPWVFLGTVTAFLVVHNLHALRVHRGSRDFGPDPVGRSGPGAAAAG